MIEEKSLRAVAYTKLDTERVLILPYQDTPLEVICHDLTIDGVMDSTDSQLPDEKKVVTYVNTLDSHTAAMAELASLGVAAVRNVSDLVKNTINPHLRRVMDSIHQHGINEDQPYYGWSIAGVTLPALLTSKTAERLLAPFVTANPYKGSIDSASVGHFDSEYIKTHSQVTDEDGWNVRVTSLLSSEPFLDVVRALLHDEHKVETAEKIEKVDVEAVLVALTVLSVTTTPPAGLNMSLDTWEANRLLLRNVLANRVLLDIRRYNNAVTNSILYIEPKLKQPGIIRVNDRVYRNLIAKGLTPEVVMGNESLGRPYMTADLLNPDVVTRCEKAYALNRQSIEASRRLDNETYRVKTIQEVLRRDLHQIADRESWPVEGDTREKAWVRLRGIVDKVLSGPHKDRPIEDLVAAILLGTWYAHTDAWRLMDIALRVSKEDPELNPDEVFTLSKIQYVGQWVASQLYIRGNVDDEKDEDRVVPQMTVEST